MTLLIAFNQNLKVILPCDYDVTLSLKASFFFPQPLRLNVNPYHSPVCTTSISLLVCLYRDAELLYAFFIADACALLPPRWDTAPPGMRIYRNKAACIPHLWAQRASEEIERERKTKGRVGRISH